ncbi:MAG: hypothetical protein KatS3mg111_2848 [Pirellulaceae bacterium]|nr:MAG: hypothetical protein KatS3mg111_2848 [Pirellulaceae bacterium]
MPRRYRVSSARRRGFTLIEVMIATAVTLLMMIALAQMFKIIGDSMKRGRAALQLNNRLRTVVMRLQHDLENLTVVPRPPATEGEGYLKYFDGSTTDYTASTISPLLNRFGDVDDILMGTVRAGDVWFTGKVPRYFITGIDDPTDVDEFTMVTIAAQHAEFCAFLQPIVSNVGNPTQDPSYYLTASPNGAAAFQDVDGPGGTANGFPDGFRLHYRRLLIRPDLNTIQDPTTGQLVLPFGRGVNAGGAVDWTMARPQPGLPSPLCDMTAAHQQCDLSIRRVYDAPIPNNSAADRIAANSLEDLAHPANRFAHVQVPIPGTSSTTMPVLALGPPLSVNTYDPDGTLGGSGFRVGSGFLHPAFALYGTRVGEDLLASQVLAFDVKVFDPAVPLLLAPGPNGTLDGGIDGSDDFVVGPSDPGFVSLLGNTPHSYGDYVDLCWGRKTAAAILQTTGTAPPPSDNLVSPFSGYSSTNYASFGFWRGFTDQLYKSGLVLTTPNNAIHLLQPAFDTWTTEFERDGVLQATRVGREGICRISGLRDLYGVGGDDTASALPAWRQMFIDGGTDGVDNNDNGLTDEGYGNYLPVTAETWERETSPPFPVDLQGIRITVRMEDPGTRQIRQMSVTKEFVSR